MKGKGEKKRYTHLNAEFQRLARRDKKACLNDQFKGIEENNRMGKTRDLFKKIKYTKGTLHAKMGIIKDRNGMDLTEAEDIKKRWQEYIEELYKTDLNDLDKHDGVINHFEPDTLKCDVKGAIESITGTKLGEGMELQPSYFKSSKMVLLNCYTQYASKFGNSEVATGLEEVSSHSNPKERQCQRMLKLPHSCTHLTC